MKRIQFLLGMILCVGVTANAQTGVGTGLPLFSLNAVPEISIPLGSDAKLFPLGGGANLSATYRLPAMPLLFLGGEIGYSFMSTTAPGTSVSLVNLGALAGVHLQINQSLSARFLSDAGYFMATLNESGSPLNFNPFVGGAATFGFDLARNLTISAGAGYRYYFGLYGALNGNLGLSYRFPARSTKEEILPPGYAPVPNDRKGLQLLGVKLDTVFPVFFKYYDDHPIGSAILRNYETVPAENVRAFLIVKQYMTDPKECKVPLVVAPGKNGEITLYALFTDKILEVAEATKVALGLTIEYQQYGKDMHEDYVQTISVLDRNALTWSDDRKAAAFISARDPQALSFAKGVSVAVKDWVRKGISDNLQSAIAIHEALLKNGITYVSDPTSALTTSNREVVDFLQYPQQTLGFRAGKCGDLTVLYCSLLESIGIATSLITVPGHILMAFDLEMTPEEAAKTFSNQDDFIYQDGKTWLPIETTLRTGHFLDAWAEGIHQWRTGVQQKTVAFYQVRESWQSYNPIVFSGSAASPAMPSQSEVAQAFKSSLQAFVNNQISSRVADLQDEIKSTNGNPRVLNRLGVLYAKFGVFDKAEEQFLLILKKQDPDYALSNMGNLCFLRGDFTRALGYYMRAQQKQPSNSKVLLAIAQTNLALEKFNIANQTYEKLKSIDPDLASHYAFIGSSSSQGTRAADVQKAKGEVLWQE
jgi:hypothetical protein